MFIQITPNKMRLLDAMCALAKWNHICTADREEGIEQEQASGKTIDKDAIIGSG